MLLKINPLLFIGQEGEQLDQEVAERLLLTTVIHVGHWCTQQLASSALVFPNHGSSDSVMEARCRYWPNCKNAKCKFFHPTEADATPIQATGADVSSILEITPGSVCRYGANCRSPQCKYSHPGGKSTSSKPCKFGSNCTRQFCTFTHPDPGVLAEHATNSPKQLACRFGSGCTKQDCTFTHPPRNPGETTPTETPSQVGTNYKKPFHHRRSTPSHGNPRPKKIPNAGDISVTIAQARKTHVDLLSAFEGKSKSARITFAKSKKKWIRFEDMEKLEEAEKANKDKITEMQSILKEFDLATQVTGSTSEIAPPQYKQLVRECKRLQGSLPAYARRSLIVNTVRQHSAVVVVGETGSGKSTQIPQYLAEIWETGAILCTQPRALAALALAERVAEEWGTKCGVDVGCKLFGAKPLMCRKTRIIYTTDGMLLNEFSRDPNLKRYSCVVVDEAHERTINTDLVLAFLKQLLQRRTDFRVVVTSATINETLFSNYFGGCPVLHISGRLYPVEVRYAPTMVVNYFEPKVYRPLAVKKICSTLKRSSEGDILVFVASQEDCEKVKETVSLKVKDKQSGIRVVALHGSSSPEDRKIAMMKSVGGRKVVIATNIAETSLTIDGVVYVIDTGMAKELVYDSRRDMEVLTLDTITRTSAEQRKGRAGRTQAGICERLYTQEFFEEMRTHPVAEINRRHLGMAILALKEKHVPKVREFDYIQRPEETALTEAIKLLELLGALDTQEKLTEMGALMSRMPTLPMISKMILTGRTLGVEEECLQLAAILSVSDRLFRFKRDDVNSKNALKEIMSDFNLDGGDMINLLDLFRTYLAEHPKRRYRWCVQNHISASMMKTGLETLVKHKRGLMYALHSKRKKRTKKNVTQRQVVQEDKSIAREESESEGEEDFGAALPEESDLEAMDKEEHSEQSASLMTALSSVKKPAEQDPIGSEKSEEQTRIVEPTPTSSTPTLTPTAIAGEPPKEDQNPASDIKTNHRQKKELDPEVLTRIRRAICAGFFINTSRLDLQNRYHILRLQQMANIHPSSFPETQQRPSRWIVYAELKRTNRDYIKMISDVEKEWILEASPQFAKEVGIDREPDMESFITEIPSSHLRGIFLGPNGCRAALSAEWQANIEVENQTLPPHVAITTEKKNVANVRSKLEKLLKDRETELRQEVEERTVCGTRIVIGEGGHVTAVLSPGEYVRIRLTKIPIDVPTPSLWRIVNTAGNKRLAKLRVIRDPPKSEYHQNDKSNVEGAPASQGEKNTTCTAFAIFRDYPSARHAVEELHESLHFGGLIEAAPVETSDPSQTFSGKGISGCSTIKVSWVNALGVGRGSIVFEQDCTPPPSISICGVPTRVVIGKDKMKQLDTKQWFIPKLDPYVVEGDIRDALMTLPGLPPVAKIIIPRQQSSSPSTTEEDDLDMFVATLQSLFSQYGAIASTNLFTEGARRGDSNAAKKSTTGQARIEYLSGESAVNAVTDLNGKVGKIGKGKLSVMFEPYNSIPFPHTNLYKRLKDEITARLEEYGKKYPSLSIKVSRNLDRIDLRSKQNIREKTVLDETVNAIAEIRAELKKDLLHGRAFGLEYWKLTQKLAIRKQIEDETNCFVLPDGRRKRVLVYGPPPAVEKAKLLLQELLTQHSMNTCMFPIRPKLVSVLRKGWKDQLVKENEGVTLELDFQRRFPVLSIKGPPGLNLEPIKQKIQLKGQELYANQGVELEEEEEDRWTCGICFCGNAKEDRGLIFVCGHFVCQDCFRAQLDLDTSGLPLKCPKCNQLLSLCDFYRNDLINEEAAAKLNGKILDKYVAEHPNEYVYCGECGVAVLRKADKSPVILCPNPECKAQLCGLCKKATHGTAICDQETKAVMEALVQGNPNRYKRCGHCTKPQERIGGCNAMICVYCQGHWCWLCGRGFAENAHRHFSDPKDPCYEKLFLGCGGVYEL